MRRSSVFILALCLAQAYSAPQFITFSEGKLGVNFGGYHAGVGLGGASGKGAAGGLYAEAGTPFGPAARAGLGGSVDGNSGSTGGLFAGATAGGNVNAAAGLGGSVAGGKAIGGGYSAASAGGHSSTAVLGGESESSGGAGFSITAHKSIGVPTTIVKETEVSVVPVQEVKTVNKKVYTEAKFDASNEIAPIANSNAGVEAHVNVNANVQPATATIVKEVHHEAPPTVVYRKHKPHRHHLHKTVYLGGYVGAGAEAAPPVSKTVIVNTQPIRRIDVVKEEGEAGATINGQHVGPGKVTTFSTSKEVVVNSRPSTFFQDIFNIPISTLKAVSGFLTNTAGNTNISVQKTASVNAGGYAGGYAGASGHGSHNSDAITSKHVPLSSSSSSETHVSVQTPTASKFIDDIFSIPINTLSAVNKFLENNVPARKRVQVSTEVGEEPTRIRLGPYARRKANKHVVVVQEPTDTQPAPDASN